MAKPNRSGLKNYLSTFVHQGAIIVSEERKFIYMKPAKTAGTSILRGVLDRELPDLIYNRKDSARLKQWLADIDDVKLEEYFIFSVVRNPWDRFISIASFVDIPLNEFIRDLPKLLERQEIYVHCLPLHFYTHLNDKPFIDVALRFETIQNDFESICEIIGIKAQSLPMMRTSNHTHYADYYDENSKQAVADIYAKDIEYFNYTFG